MTSSQKPPYIDPATIGTGHPLSFGPPLLFRDVTARVFPLKANIGRLTEFCDSYLNMDIPPEIVRFTPALPYVYFMVLNYGGMTATSLAAQRAGWVSQHEVFFLVPLQRWRRENGKLVFKGFANSTPFIFVDDPMSQTTGREVYGWPKVQAWIDADPSFWTKHPRAPTRLFTMTTDIFTDVFSGERDSRRELITVERDMVASWAEFPANWKCPWSPTSVWPNWITSSLGLMSDAADIAAGLRLRGYPGRDPGALVAMGREALSLGGAALSGLWPDALGRLLGAPARDTDPYNLSDNPGRLDAPRFFTNSINLKQFRNPERPETACYTALVDSAMGVDRVNGIGLMGDWDLLRGDPSGGYSVGIRRYQAQPILDTLGIEVPTPFAREREGDLVTLRPSFPFWMDVDLLYGAGKVICFYGRNGWSDGAAGPATRAAAPEARPAEVARKPMRSSATGGAGFNTALGAAVQPLIGPFTFPDVTVQVYPLLADSAKLKRLVDGAWNDLFNHEQSRDRPPRLRLEPMGSYVYLVVSAIGDHFGTMYSSTSNIGWWADREIAFCIPVRWYENGELVSVALIEPFVYANKGRAVVTDREVNGRNSFTASIESAQDVWLDPGGPQKPRRLVHVASETFIALNQGQTAAEKSLLEIDERDALVSVAAEEWRGVADDWGFRIAEELKRKTAIWEDSRNDILSAEALTLETLARFKPFNRLTLKQYRDAEEMDKACYQAVVHTERTITRVHEIGELEKPVHVWLHRLPNHPLVESLGLEIKTTQSNQGGVVDCLQPIRPFWMRVALKEELGRVLFPLAPAASARRHGATSDIEVAISGAEPAPGARPMRFPHHRPHYFLMPHPTDVVRGWPARIQKNDRRGLAEKADVWLRDALSNEIAWARLQFGRRDDLETLRADLMGAAPPGFGLERDLESVFALLGSGPLEFSAFLRNLPLERKFRLADALRTKTGEPPLRDPARSKALHSLGLAGEAIEKLTEEGKAALQQALQEAAQKDPRDADLPEYIQELVETYAAGLDRLSADAAGRFKREVEPIDKLAQLADALKNAVNAVAREHTMPSGRTAKPLPQPAPSPHPDLFEQLRRLEFLILRPAEAGGAAWDLLISEQAVESIDNIRFKRFLADYDLEPHERALVETTFDPVAQEVLQKLLALAEGPHATPFHLLQRSYEAAAMRGQTPPFDPVEALRLVSDRFGACVEDWQYPARWRRLRPSDASKVVSALDEVQLVMEAILDHGWESGSPAAPPAGPEILRAPGVAASSVGPMTGDDAADWAARHGLRSEANAREGLRFYIADNKIVS